jgi:hypothetical protein
MFRTAVFVLVASLGFSAQVASGQHHGSHRHVDRLALEVKNLASKACWEMHNSYRFYPEYEETYGEAFEMYKIAEHIHELVHYGSSAKTIDRNVVELDKLFHHIEEDVRAWGVYGHTGSHARLKNRMLELEDALHHLMDDVGVKSAFEESTPPRP